MRIRRAFMVGAALAAAALPGLACGGDGGRDRGGTSPSSRLTERAKRAPAPATARSAKGSVTYCAGSGRSGAEADAVERFNRRFASRSLNAKLLTLGASDREQRDRLIRRLDARSRQCDVMAIDVTWTAEFATQKWLLDMTDYVKRRKGEFIPATLATVRFDGEKDWAVPKQADAGFLYYRSDQLDSIPPTWQAVYDEARQARGIVYAGAANEGLTVSFLEVAYAAGGKVLSPDGKKAEIDSPQNARALQLMVDGIKRGAAPKAVTAYTEADARRAFDAGQATFMRNWPDAYAAARRSPRVRDSFKIAPFPPFDDGGTAGVVGGRNLAISAFSDDPKAALALVDYLTGAEAVARAAQEHAIAPPLEAAYDDPHVRRALPYVDELHSAVRQAKPRPVTPVYQQISSAISQNVNLALSGQQSPQDALRKAEDQIDQALSTL
jgi:multiple sugar transport system substrate-binding protein